MHLIIIIIIIIEGGLLTYMCVLTTLLGVGAVEMGFKKLGFFTKKTFKTSKVQILVIIEWPARGRECQST